jgi:hypothetical protein
MTWKQAATLVVIVFTLTLLQAMVASPLVTLQDDLKDSGNLTNEHWDGEQLITDLTDKWFTMGLVALFVLPGVAIAFVVRRELTRQQRRP